MTVLSAQEQQISFIVKNRHALARDFDKKIRILDSLTAVLDAMDQRRNEIVNSISNENVKNKLIAIDLDGILNVITLEKQKLCSYHGIFSRNTINIGVVGLARQGKSQLLRSLSGLDDTIIPTGSYGHCTGTKSIFINENSSNPHGEIHFYNESEFIEKIINPYYKELLASITPPRTIDDFEKNSLPPLPVEKQHSVSDKTKYNQLELYKNNIGKYKHFLFSASPITVSVDNIREYVAQDDVSGERSSFRFMAVKEAHIFCRFPHETMSNIALIDMPGLGDTGLVAEEWLDRTLLDEIDVVLFVKKPSGLGEVWKPQELGLYDAIRSAQPEIPMNLRSLLIMNRVNSPSPNENNVKNCERMARESIDKMAFADVLIADCADAADVNNVVLLTLLTHLTKTATQINSSFVLDGDNALKRIHAQIKIELHKADEAIGIHESSVLNFNSFNKLFRETIKRVYSGLEKLTNDLKAKRDMPDLSFEKYVIDSKESAYINAGIPSLDKIEETRNLFGGYKSACEYYLNYIRTHLTQHFEQLEEGLAESVESVKSQLAIILISVEKGSLTNISATGGSAFLGEVSTLLGEQYPVLDPAFKTLVNFKLSYQGFFYYRLRKHLDYLTPDTGMAELSAKPSAQEIYDLLTAMHKIALERIESEINYWSVEINHAIFATVEQFVDKVLRSENAMDEWQSFYMSNRGRIWPESFPEFFIDNRLRWQWIDVVERLRTINKSIVEKQ
ncbi:hypothetical protein CLV58_13535 [Spirosoma oryzae]|uniref:Dynamin family protein n=1 Tax=Spirosoma oryzae TaxID=1469603 RepID=A0A2T0S155_9BACT|nr:hypothetical protein [Spirosoma oryzae]PRY27033.1 hypothetical protein CLV58_13535 [Spirosoma oryzae]